LLLAALSRGISRLIGALKSDDTRYMAEALRAMGVSVAEPDATSFVVTATGRRQAPAPSSPSRRQTLVPHASTSLTLAAR
jgi:3-phosphoshikimate 1-carboxyvinyltransferase